MTRSNRCECFARCEADCVCDADWTPEEVICLRAELAECKRDAERDILKQDAERYRWIIKHMRLGIGQNGAYWSLTDATQVAPNHIGEVDATIDAALRGEE